MSRFQNKWFVLAVVELGVLLCSIDATIVVLALPTMASALHQSIADIQWISVSYTITCAVTLTMAGKCAELLGRKKAYLLGFAIFTLASLITGLASDLNLVVLMRIFTALGTAFLLSSGNAIITAVFPKNQHGLALGLGATVFSVGVAAGLSLGALILHFASWRWIFLINFPVGMAALAAGAVIFDSQAVGPPKAAKHPIDWLGALLLTSGLTAFLLSLQSLAEEGRMFLPFLAASAVLVVLLAWVERRAADPVLPPWLFGVPEILTGSITRIIMRMAGAGVTFTLPFYLQRNLSLSPAAAGMLLLANVAVYAVAGPLSGHWADRWGVRKMLPAGLGLLTLGVALHGVLPGGVHPADAAWLAVVVAAQAIMGFGSALFGSPNAKAAMHAVAREHHALVSGVLWTTTFVGQSLGTAAAAVILSFSGGPDEGPLLNQNWVFAFFSGTLFIAVILSWRRAAKAGEPENSDDFAGAGSEA